MALIRSGDSPNHRKEIELGVVVKPHGLKGGVKARLYNMASSALHQCREVTLVLPSEQHRVGFQIIGSAGDCLLLHVEGVKDRDEAEHLRGAKILVDRAAVEPLEEGQYLCADLLGCHVVDEQDQPLGTVSNIFSAGASDVLVVEEGSQERLIPLVKEWVVSVDVEARRIQVTGADQWEPQER